MTIEERLEKMERKVRRIDVLIVAAVFMAILALSTAVGLAIAPGTAIRKDAIKARAFILVDENGKIRASLDTYKGGPRLALFDENGKTGALLSTHKDVSFLGLFDENEKFRALPGGSEDGPALSLYDANERTRIFLRVRQDGVWLSLLDEKGKTRASLGRNKVTTPDGKVISYPESSLLMFDPNERVIWSAP